MKKHTKARLLAGMGLLALASVPAFGAHSVTSGLTPEQLVNILVPMGGTIHVVDGSEKLIWGSTTFSDTQPILGPGIDPPGPGLPHVNSSPTMNSAGSFSSATPDTGLPFQSGVVLSTGFLSNTVGPNTSDFITPVNTRPDSAAEGSSLLEEVINDMVPGSIPAGKTRDAVTLSFQFTADLALFAFHYAFASEEYKEFIDEDVNDAFAFVLTDSGGNKVNLAVVPPFSGTPVSVDTINPAVNSDYYLDNPFGPSAPYDIQFDGIGGGIGKQQLWALGIVNPGEVYTISLVIADVNDRRGDSAVFLEQNSFISSDPVPEPATYVGALALAGLFAKRLRRKKS